MSEMERFDWGPIEARLNGDARPPKIEERPESGDPGGTIFVDGCNAAEWGGFIESLATESHAADAVAVGREIAGRVLTPDLPEAFRLDVCRRLWWAEDNEAELVGVV